MIFMQKISDIKYLVDYDEIMDLINKGYEPIGDLKEALEYPGILICWKNEIPIIIREDWKTIDTYFYYKEDPCPKLTRIPGISETQANIRDERIKLWGKV